MKDNESRDRHYQGFITALAVAADTAPKRLQWAWDGVDGPASLHARSNVDDSLYIITCGKSGCTAWYQGEDAADGTLTEMLSDCQTADDKKLTKG